MASMLVGSFPVASSVTAVGSCWRSKKGAKSYYDGSYVTKASWYKTEKIQNEYPIVRHQQHNYRGIEAASTYEACARSYVVNATRGESFEPEPQDATPKSFWSSIKYSLDAFYRFSCRPYAMIATGANLISMSLLAVEKLSDISPTFFIGLLKAMAAVFSIHLYGMGLNNLADIEIDKINKPYLPLASGEFSFGTGVIMVISCLILSFGIGWIVGSPPLFWIISSQFILGSAYSINLPLLRWKRSPVLTAMLMVVERGIVFQLASFLHMQTYVFKRPTMFPRSLIFAIVFTSFFSIAVALSKDIPDIEGDEKFGIRSLAVRLGQKRVFWICVSILEMSYGFAILVGATSSCLWSKLITSLGHALLASLLWYRAKSIDLKSKASTQSFYMFIWKLYYAECFIIPLVR